MPLAKGEGSDMRWTVFLLASLASTTASFADVTYVMDLVIPGFPADLIEATGQLQTDGKMGVLSPGDLVSFNLSVAGPGLGVSFNSDDTIVSLIGADLVASGRFITFDYGANDGGIFSFQDKFVPSGTLFWCNATAGQSDCSQGTSLFGLPPVPPPESSVTLTGTVVLGSVPEPATWSMMLLGFAGLGFAGYRRTRAPRAALTKRWTSAVEGNARSCPRQDREQTPRRWNGRGACNALRLGGES
jgi:hypothetical protein